MGGAINSVLCCKKNKNNDTTISRTSSIPIESIYNRNSRTDTQSFKSRTFSRTGTIVRSLSRLPIKTSSIIRRRGGYPSDYYKKISTLGNGSYGCVVKVSHMFSGQVRAMKIISKANLVNGVTESDIEREIEILKNMDHPNVIKIFEFFVDDFNFYLITEYCTEGDLCQKLDRLGYFNENIVRILMFQVFSAINYLHSKNVMHGDIKLENIMIDSIISSKRTSFVSSIVKDLKELDRKTRDGNSDTDLNSESSSPLRKSMKYKNFDNFKEFELKLIDFGCSKIFTKDKKTFNDIIGTLYYIAPEVINNNYDKKCDIWSGGVVMYALLSGHFPFIGKNEEEIMKNISDLNFHFNHSELKTVSQTARDLIRWIFTSDPKKRPSAQEVLAHPFFTEDINPNNLFCDNLETREILNQLKQAKINCKFYQSVLTFLTHNFAEKEEILTIKKVFMSIDKNLDGKISKEELIESYKENNLDITEEEIQRILKVTDNDNNGSIEYEEFIRATIRKEILFSDTNLRLAFDMFDFDGSGAISCEELKEVMGIGDKTTSNVLVDLLNEINKTEEDEITFEEFSKIMNSLIVKE